MPTVALISDDPRIQAHYEKCLENGCTPKLAESLAFREGPALRTDVTLLQGHSNGNQFEKTPQIGNWYRHMARKAGVSTQGKVYLSSLANFPGDPRAWVSDRHDVQQLVKERGWKVNGAVNQNSQPQEEPKDHRPAGGVAPDIIENELTRAIEQNPEIAPTPKEKADLREKIRQKRKPHWAKAS